MKPDISAPRGTLPVKDSQIFDLAAYLVCRPEDTFYIQVSGESLLDVGVEDGDILIVDGSKQPRPSDLIVSETDEGFTIKKFKPEQFHLRVLPSERGPVPEGHICGVAVFAIHRL